MIGFLVRAAGLTAIYLLVLTSVEPGDVLVGGAIGLALSAALRPRRAARDATPPMTRLVAWSLEVARTAREMVIGTWRVARFCLGAPYRPGFVEIPAEDRSGHELALWGVLTGEAPDEVVVTVDRGRGVMTTHLVDAEDPDGIRARHREAHERWRRRVVR